MNDHIHHTDGMDNKPLQSTRKCVVKGCGKPFIVVGKPDLAAQDYDHQRALRRKIAKILIDAGYGTRQSVINEFMRLVEEETEY